MALDERAPDLRHVRRAAERTGLAGGAWIGPPADTR
jgi:hypothetical protein